jgi:hypothetical protein
MLNSKYNIIFSLFFLNTSINAFCESRINNSIVLQNTYNISIIGHEFKTEIGNSISSLVYSVIGLYGNYINNHNYYYYVLNNIFILMGITSALHHFFYTNNSWAYYSDIICVELIISFTLLVQIYYIIKRKIYFINASIFILANFLTMVVSNNIDLNLRTHIIKFNIGYIIGIQILTNLQIFYIKNKIYGIILLKHNISNFILLSLAIIFFYNDDYCNEKSIYWLNPHSLWHVFSGLALNNCFHTTLIYYCLVNNIKYKIIKITNLKSLCFINNILKYILLYIELDNNKYKNSSTSINLEDIRLLKIEEGFHRRIRSHG